MTVQHQKRGPYAKSQAQRDVIIAAALEYFRQYGYHGVSMREIARAAGLSQAGLLHHFKSKDELLQATLDVRDALSGALARAELAGAPGEQDPLEQIVAIVRDNARHPELVQMFVVLSAEATDAAHPAHEYFRRRSATVIEWSKERVREAVATRHVPADIDVETAGRLVQAMMYGLQVQWLLDPTTDMVALFESFLGSMARSVNVPGDGRPAPSGREEARGGVGDRRMRAAARASETEGAGSSVTVSPVRPRGAASRR